MGIRDDITSRFPRLVTPAAPPAPTEVEVWSPKTLVAAPIQDPEAFIGDDVASRGTVTLIAGRRGSGKTYLLLHLAACIATAAPFGDIPTRQGRVLFLSQEMGKSAIRKRLRRMFTPNQLATLEGNLDIVCKLPFTLDSNEGLQNLLTVLRSSPWDVLIVDTLRDVKGSARENDNDEMAQVFVRFRDLVCEPFNLAGLLNHHKGKPSQDGADRGSRGASSMEDVAADVLYIAKSDSSRTITFEKTRDGATEGKHLDFSISDNPDDPSYLSINVFESSSPAESSAELHKLYSTLEHDNQSLYSKEDIQKLLSLSPRSTDRWISAAKAADRLLNTTRSPAKALYRYVPLQK